MPTTTIDVAVTTEKSGTGFDAIARRAESGTRLFAMQWSRRVQSLARAKAPVRTGHLRSSIKAGKVSDGVWRVEAGAHYAVYVEYGTRYMRAQPYFRPAVAEATRMFQADFRTVLRRG